MLIGLSESLEKAIKLFSSAVILDVKKEGHLRGDYLLLARTARDLGCDREWQDDFTGGEEQMTKTRDGVSSRIGVHLEPVEGRAATVVLACRGFIDTYNSADFTRQVRAAMDNGAKNLIFDLKSLNYISSAGVGTFPAFLKEVKQFGGNIVIAAMQQRVLAVFELLGFGRFFNVAGSVEEALDFFPQEKSGRSIPYDRMERVTDSFARLEVFVPIDQQASFYGELVAILRMIDDLKSGQPLALLRNPLKL